MAGKVTIRPQRLTDARRFFEILNNENFLYFRVRPETIEEQKAFLRRNDQKRKENYEHNYAILLDGRLVGACGIKIDQHRPFIGEIGYFLDEECWGCGITTQAVKLLEQIGFSKLGLERIVIQMHPGNKASERVAVKCGYRKEGLMRKATKHPDGTFTDARLYAKTKTGK
jgi:ribosomal-protein-alanine N-acetyltransferase